MEEDLITDEERKQLEIKIKSFCVITNVLDSLNKEIQKVPDEEKKLVAIAVIDSLPMIVISVVDSSLNYNKDKIEVLNGIIKVLEKAVSEWKKVQL